jgi:hypothetical protein
VAVTHSAFGLVLNSNLPIPGLTVAQPSSAADIQIRLGILPFPLGKSQEESLFFESSYLGESGEPTLRIWKLANGRLLHLTYDDGVQFWLDHQGRRIWAAWPETLSLEEMATYLIGPVLGFVLRLRGTTCLHASAVALETQAVAFVGPAGAGKSTTAATMGREGCAVLSDDIVSVTERGAKLYVMPSFPFISLWPESVNMLYGSPDSLPRFIPDWEKRRLSLENGEVQFQRQPLSLGAIYLFGDRTDAEKPYIGDIPARIALLGLVANTYATNLLDRETRAREFEVLGRLVASVPVRRLYLPREAGRPDELCKLISQDCRSILQPPGVR